MLMLRSAERFFPAAAIALTYIYWQEGVVTEESEEDDRTENPEAILELEVAGAHHWFLVQRRES
jgi:hypothetical protein